MGTQRRAASKSVVIPNQPGRFGVYGGRYVPETLMAALEELEREYDKARNETSNLRHGWTNCCELMRDVLLRYFSRGG